VMAAGSCDAIVVGSEPEGIAFFSDFTGGGTGRAGVAEASAWAASPRSHRPGVGAVVED
jgi:hypothetical protein